MSEVAKMTPAEAIAFIEANIEHVGYSSKTFAQSLIAQNAVGKKLSPKQWEWVGILALRAEKALSTPVEGKNEMISGANFKAAVDFMTGSKLKWPTLYLSTSSGNEIKLGVMGPNSHSPGSVKITHHDKYIGKITADGSLHIHPMNTFPEDGLVALLSDIGHASIQTASKQGHMTGRCCFCKIELTDETSLAIGYGQTCAKNYGLPWGKTVAKHMMAGAEVVVTSTASKAPSSDISSEALTTIDLDPKPAQEAPKPISEPVPEIVITVERPAGLTEMDWLLYRHKPSRYMQKQG